MTPSTLKGLFEHPHLLWPMPLHIPPVFIRECEVPSTERLVSIICKHLNSEIIQAVGAG